MTNYPGPEQFPSEKHRFMVGCCLILGVLAYLSWKAIMWLATSTS
jgi:hypothetical protein